MDFTLIISIVVSGVVTDNIVLSQTLGICPFLGVSKKLDSALGMGFAVTFVLAISTVVCYLLYQLLVALGYEYLQTILFILIIAALVQLLDIVLKKISPSLYNALGVYLALITTNCCVLGTANNVITNGYDLVTGLIHAIAIGLGFTLALVLMAGVRSKTERSDCPKSFKGLPLALITAGIMSMAFAGFAGLSF